MICWDRIELFRLVYLWVKMPNSFLLVLLQGCRSLLLLERYLINKCGDMSTNRFHNAQVRSTRQRRAWIWRRRLTVWEVTFWDWASYLNLYFCLVFFLLKRRKGTKWTIKYILERDLQPDKNWLSSFCSHVIPQWRSLQNSFT